jgi:biopolymer transport protein ExbB
VFTLVEAAGWPIWLLIIASLVAVTLITERALFLRRKNIVPPNLLDEVVQELKQRGVSQQMLTKLSEGSPLGRVFAAGLKNIKNSPEVMKDSIEEAGRSAAHSPNASSPPRAPSPPSATARPVRYRDRYDEILGSQNAGGAAPTELALASRSRWPLRSASSCRRARRYRHFRACYKPHHKWNNRPSNWLRSCGERK